MKNSTKEGKVINMLSIAKQQGVGVIKGLLSIPLVIVVVIALAFAFYEGRKAYYDAQVDEMCAKDGGIKVYETVELPVEYFNEWGQPRYFHPGKSNRVLRQEYPFEEVTHYYKKGSPSLISSKYQIIRQADGRLLGETILYSRGGGDLPGPWYPSGYTCPNVNKSGFNALLKSIFISSKGD